MRDAARRPELALLACIGLTVACDATPSTLVQGSTPAQVAAAEPAAGVAPDVTDLLAQAAARERSGDLDGALAQAEAALRTAEAGAQALGGKAHGAQVRDAALTVAKLAILLERHDRAAAVLEPLVQRDANDAVAQYDLALVHQHRDDYNRARSGYLAALRADPTHADARFNLAMLCWRRGVHAEARHHADVFRARFPDDPRGGQLAAMTAEGAAPPPAG